jgi:hypothetical protein
MRKLSRSLIPSARFGPISSSKSAQAAEGSCAFSFGNALAAPVGLPGRVKSSVTPQYGAAAARRCGLQARQRPTDGAILARAGGSVQCEPSRSRLDLLSRSGERLSAPHPAEDAGEHAGCDRAPHVQKRQRHQRWRRHGAGPAERNDGGGSHSYESGWLGSPGQGRDCDN